jgi:hypothetical protein
MDEHIVVNLYEIDDIWAYSDWKSWITSNLEEWYLYLKKKRSEHLNLSRNILDNKTHIDKYEKVTFMIWYQLDQIYIQD